MAGGGGLGTVAAERAVPCLQSVCSKCPLTVVIVDRVEEPGGLPGIYFFAFWGERGGAVWFRGRATRWRENARKKCPESDVKDELESCACHGGTGPNESHL